MHYFNKKKKTQTNTEEDFTTGDSERKRLSYQQIA